MIQISELKKGCYVLAENEGQAWEGEVTDFNHDEKEICVDNGVQEFWFPEEHLFPIPITDERLLNMHFSKVVNEDGSVKYMKDAFRILIPRANDFNMYEIWYKDEHRRIVEPISLHQLQNHYLEMTKIHLTDAPLI